MIKYQHVVLKLKFVYQVGSYSTISEWHYRMSLFFAMEGGTGCGHCGASNCIQR
jgi:hypothetical protein